MQNQSNHGGHLEINGGHFLIFEWPRFLNRRVTFKDDLYQISRLYHHVNDFPKILLLFPPLLGQGSGWGMKNILAPPPIPSVFIHGRAVEVVHQISGNNNRQQTHI